MIIVRTLNTVGGNRPARKGTRKLNRFARAHGFHTFAAMKADFELRMRGYLADA
ncbi:hypothetical protein [Burkholderia cepacia]|uniref:hypothetical protein n=1 Tax=Burkholderia cepacia TaxID=292 RepID=UPI001CF2F6CB|nr:hypothetical protein [Burkholderia cepacia]MCA8110284.1 hypothetical protein [Burkholderia cepacia]MCA8396583.1 hypothetical protein [Burkholderia cepacia]